MHTYAVLEFAKLMHDLWTAKCSLGQRGQKKQVGKKRHRLIIRPWGNLDSARFFFSPGWRFVCVVCMRSCWGGWDFVVVKSAFGYCCVRVLTCPPSLFAHRSRSSWLTPPLIRACWPSWALCRTSHTPHPADIITSITRNQHKPLFSEPVKSHASFWCIIK